MMNKFRLLLLASSLFVLNGIGHAQTSTMSLNSSNPKISMGSQTAGRFE